MIGISQTNMRTLTLRPFLFQFIYLIKTARTIVKWEYNCIFTPVFNPFRCPNNGRNSVRERLARKNRYALGLLQFGHIMVCNYGNNPFFQGT
jgi:hypothetical protein